MNILSILVDTYFRIMKSINVRSISIVIIVVIILIEILEIFIKPEDIEASFQSRPRKNKAGKSNFLRKLVKLDKKKKDPVTNVKIHRFSKDYDGNYFIVDANKKIKETPIMVTEEKEILGSKSIEINTVLDGNNLYLERIEKSVEE